MSCLACFGVVGVCVVGVGVVGGCVLGVVCGCVVVLCMCVCYRDLMTLAIQRPGYEDDGDDDYDV